VEAAPDEVFLNFCNYDEDAAAEVREHIEDSGGHVRYTGWGPEIKDVIDHG
jgi:hypothetical protein